MGDSGYKIDSIGFGNTAFLQFCIAHTHILVGLCE
jgi:hypothetical protein